ncbi:MAG: nitrophenyl compound nitroreductase subunit ArsF family protein [Thermoguttaceae bacterium]
MSTKNAFTISLLLFVAASLVALTVKISRRGPQSLAATEAGDDSYEARHSGSPDLPMRDGVKVYYFHSNTRCTNCRNVEAFAREAVESGFADQLKARKIVWLAINYETPGNEHYVIDYEIVAPNLVLAMFKGGTQVKWIGLKEVVDEAGDKAAFMDLLHKRLCEFLQDPDLNL